LPEVIEVIAGRFERNPPLYYEMRLERAKGRIARDPLDLPAFDDAGVACDRLGRGDEAIAWMAQKKAALDAMPARDGPCTAVTRSGRMIAWPSWDTRTPRRARPG
jgi:hypothetical protein